MLATITDQSGDATPNNGDGNADFNEGYVAGAGHGVIQQTLLAQVGSVLLGPNGAPGAVGPTDNNDDYTNKSTNPANIAPGGTTTVSATPAPAATTSGGLTLPPARRRSFTQTTPAA